MIFNRSLNWRESWLLSPKCSTAGTKANIWQLWLVVFFNLKKHLSKLEKFLTISRTLLGHFQTENIGILSFETIWSWSQFITLPGLFRFFFSKNSKNKLFRNIHDLKKINRANRFGYIRTFSFSSCQKWRFFRSSLRNSRWKFIELRWPTQNIRWSNWAGSAAVQCSRWEERGATFSTGTSNSIQPLRTLMGITSKSILFDFFLFKIEFWNLFIFLIHHL